MPWCENCDRFYNPNSMSPDGTCRQCGAFIASPEDENDQDEERVPWHFWILVVAAVIYLGWRLIQGIGWLVG